MRCDDTILIPSVHQSNVKMCLLLRDPVYSPEVDVFICLNVWCLRRALAKLELLARLSIYSTAMHIICFWYPEWRRFVLFAFHRLMTLNVESSEFHVIARSWSVWRSAKTDVIPEWLIPNTPAFLRFSYQGSCTRRWKTTATTLWCESREMLRKVLSASAWEFSKPKWGRFQLYKRTF